MRYAILFCFALTAVYADDLDNYVPQDVQKASGLTGLPTEKRDALAAYLRVQLGPKQNEQVIQQTYDSLKDKQLSLSENIQDGRYLRLSDGSVWEVDPSDVNRSQVWLFPVQLLIQKNGRSDYPFTLINKNTGSRLDARPTSLNP